MELLVLAMLALFLIIIAISVIIYISVRRNSVDKKFYKVFDSKLDDDLDNDDDDDYVPINIVMPSSFKKEEIVENEEPKKEEEKVNIINPVVIKETKESKLEDVVNVLINKRNYIFLANNNVVSKNDHIKLILDGKVYFGTITKANYQRDVSTLKTKPRKLIIVKKKEKSDSNKNIKKQIKKDSLLEMEFIPVKKEKA